MVNSGFASVDLATTLFTYNLLIFMLLLPNTQEPGNQAAQRPARRLTIQPRVGMRHPAKVTGREGSSRAPKASQQPLYRHSVWGWGWGFPEGHKGLCKAAPEDSGVKSSPGTLKDKE